MRCSSLPVRAAPLTFALAAAVGLATPGASQGRSAEDTRAIESYRLTMPMLRKVLPAMYALGARRCEQRTHRDPMTLRLAEMTRTLEACSPMAKSLREAGVQPREAAIVYAALLNVSRQVALRDGNASALPPGAVRDNALLLEKNDPEIRKLTETGGQS
jgi:hypothetical protein